MDATDAAVLLIDDDAGVRDGIGRLLRSAGWQTRTFASAREFIDAGSFDGIGCLVLDVSMPEMTGPELHAWLQEQRVSLPVIYLSGEVDVPTSVLAMKRGALDVLQKPVDAEALLQAIDAAVESHRQQQQRRQSADAIECRLASLSLREREVMEHVIRGRLNKQIAADLGIAEKTVKVHRGRMMAKMRVRSVAELVTLCLSLGMGR
jgi:FixJ family two-component response regulator